MSNENVKELVFVGDLNILGGLKVFCDAIDALTLLKSVSFSVTFIGKQSTIYELSSKEYIELRALNWEFKGIKWKIESKNDYNDIMNYMSLQDTGRLAVLPTLADISGVLEQEFAAAGIPFVGSSESSISEILNQKDISKVIAEPTGADVASKISSMISKGCKLFECV